MATGETDATKERSCSKSGMLTVGQMASLNCITEKTLHLYQRKGLLEPAYVDPSTGYRYYSLDQCATLDAVTRLKAVGFSLDEIKEVLANPDVSQLRSHVADHLAKLQKQAREIEVATTAAQRILAACDAYANAPICDQIILETIPDRYGLVFDIEPFSPPDPDNAAWERALRAIKQELRDHGCPPALYQQASGVIEPDALLDGTFTVRKAVIFTDPEVAAVADRPLTLVPGGYHLVMYFSEALGSEGLSPEYPAIQRMLDYAERMGFEVAGNYIGETIASTPVFGYGGFNAFFKCELPVRRRNPAAAHRA